jgi:hypothetical protein
MKLIKGDIMSKDYKIEEDGTVHHQMMYYFDFDDNDEIVLNLVDRNKLTVQEAVKKTHKFYIELQARAKQDILDLFESKTVVIDSAYPGQNTQVEIKHIESLIANRLNEARLYGQIDATQAYFNAGDIDSIVYQQTLRAINLRLDSFNSRLKTETK